MISFIVPTLWRNPARLRDIIHDYKRAAIPNAEFILIDNNEVTACIKVTTKGSVMYKLDGIIVSDSHIIQYNNKWINLIQLKTSKKLL